MTSRKFEDILDDWLAGSPESARLDDAPPELRALADESERNRRLLVDTLWLHERVTGRPKPAPPSDFVDRALVALRQQASTLDDPVVETRTKPSQRIECGGGVRRVRTLAPGRMLGWGVTLAASVSLVMFLALTPQEPAQEPPSENVAGPPGLASTDPLAETTFAFVGLAHQLADSVRLADPDETGDWSDAGLDVGWPRADVIQLTLEAAPVGRAVRDSTASIVTGGEGIRTRVRPITESAAGAFGFLFGDLTLNEEKPST